MAYLLEVYCFLQYEASKDLGDGILNNWPVNVTGEVGKWIEGDLLQEHYNHWLEDMVKKEVVILMINFIAKLSHQM